MLIVKVGGGKNINWDYVGLDLARSVVDDQVVLVHGASATRDEIAKKLGLPTKTIISPSGITSVYTDESAIDVFLMVYCGLVNKKVVAKLQKVGINAIGLSGIDGRLWQAKRKDLVYAVSDGKTKLVRDNFTGRVEKINVELIKILLANKYLPVISPPAISFEGEIVNTDNDWAVAVLAGQLKADRLVVLFEAPGFLKDANNEKSLVKKIAKNQLDDYLVYAQGRMKKKVLGAKKALELGVKKIFWGDGRIKNPISKALAGEGTVIE